MNKIWRVLTAPMTAVVMIAAVIYIVIAFLAPGRPLAGSLRIVQMSLAVAVVYAYWANAKKCFITPTWPAPENLIALGIVLSWLSIFINGVWSILWRLSHQPAWMVNNDLYSSWVVLNVIAATLHVVAANMVGFGVPRADRLRLGLAWAFSLVLIAALVWFRPDMTAFTDQLRGWVEEPGSSRPPP